MWQMPHLAMPIMGALLLVWEARAPHVGGRDIDIGGFAIGLQWWVVDSR